jgi:type I restriction enzyme S subunit
MKKYSSYKTSGVEWIGDIPETWDSGKMKYVLSNNDGGVWGSDVENEFEGNIVIRSTEITIDGNWNFSNPLKRVLTENEIIKSKLYEGDIVITKSSGSPQHIGKSVIVSKEIELLNCCYSNFVQRIRFRNYNPKLYHFVLNSDIGRSQFQYLTTSSTGLGNLNGSSLNDILLPFIPLQEQEQIVNYLDEKTTIIDKLISTKQRKVELLKEQRTTLINQVITKGLNQKVKMKDSGVEWIGEIPEKWSFVRLGILGKFSKGKGITKDKIKENGFPCIRNGEIYTTYNLRFSKPKSFIDEHTTNESIKVKKGTLFFTGDGETLEEIGKCVVYLGEEDIYIGGGINVFTPNTEKVSPIYLSYVMSSTSCVYQKSKGGKGEIVVHIYSKQLRDIQFGLPSIEEQDKTVEYLDKHTKDIDDLVSMEQNKIELLKEYRQSLISEVITGKIKVV